MNTFSLKIPILLLVVILFNCKKYFSVFVNGSIINNIDNMIDVSHYLLNEHHTKDIPNELLNGKKSTSLNLSAKNLKSIPNSLKYVILNFNKLVKLPKHFFGLKNIEIIQLKYNNLSDVSELIGKLSKLTSIDISFNKIESLRCSISKLINLKYINISGNKLKDFPYRCKDLCNLKELDLCNNFIVNIEPICEINNLEYLHLRNLENLEELVLSSNNISFLPKSLINCKNLLKLDLHENKISFIPNELLEMLNTLRYLDLKGNDFSNTKNLETINFVKKLKEIMNDKLEIDCNNINIKTNE
ncbi:leucine-rich repeat protein [Vairimorpha apis BRL 01]|uniref:Leucine-rich repeat protein n=1 Tax=Vairimorpha apis BRL 01 TaxID=1037528 RepID=T0LDI6_9MICR|nr:leucine-rich repeat protein [Vairimorpha apis BRL 01]